MGEIRRISQFVGAELPRSAGGGGGSSFSTSFVADENPLSESGKWLNGQTDGVDWRDFQISSGVACAAHSSSSTPPPFDDSVAILKTSAIALPADQYIEGVVHKSGYTPPGTHELGLFVRAALTANSIRGYEAYIGYGGAHTLVRWNGAVNDFTPLGGENISSMTVPADGDVVRLEVSGASPATIRVYQNGNLRTELTDSTFTDGQSGLQSYMEAGGTPSGYGYDSITTGAL